MARKNAVVSQYGTSPNAPGATSHASALSMLRRRRVGQSQEEKAGFMAEFEARLAAAYQAWHESRGRTPDRFFSLYADEIELHSILEASLNDTMRGVFIGKQAAIAYFAAIAEQWEMVDGRLDDVIARGDKLVCV